MVQRKTIQALKCIRSVFSKPCKLLLGDHDQLQQIYGVISNFICYIFKICIWLPKFEAVLHCHCPLSQLFACKSCQLTVISRLNAKNCMLCSTDVFVKTSFPSIDENSSAITSNICKPFLMKSNQMDGYQSNLTRSSVG